MPSVVAKIASSHSNLKIAFIPAVEMEQATARKQGLDFIKPVMRLTESTNLRFVSGACRMCVSHGLFISTIENELKLLKICKAVYIQ